MNYPKSLNLTKKSHNTYMVYMLSLLVCLFLALYTFPAKVKAAEQKEGHKTLIKPTFRENPGAMDGFDNTHPNSLEMQRTPEILKVTDVSIKTGERTVVVTVTVKNSGAIALKDVTPNLAASGGVNLVEGPNPPSADIEAGASKTFTWIYTIISEPTEDTRFIASASGIDAHSGKLVSARLFTKAYPGTERQTVTTLTEHTNTITSVAFSPDGKLLASGSLDGTIKLWNPMKGEQVREIKTHASVLSIVFSPDGLFLASGASDGTVKLWNIEKTEKEVYSLKGHKGQVFSVAFSPDGKLLASSSWNGVIKIWNSQTGEELRTLKEHDSDILSIAFSPDGQWFAAGFADNKIRLFSPETRFLGENGFLTVGTLSEHTGQVLSIAFSPDSKQLASGSADGTVKLWDMQTKKVTHTIGGNEGNVYTIAFSPDKKLLASGAADGIIKLWNIKTGEVMYTFKEHTSGVFSVAFQPKEQSSASDPENKKQLLASGSQDTTLKLWRDIEFLSVYIIDKDSFSKSITTKRSHIKFAVNYLSTFASEDILYSWQFNDEEWTEAKINSVSLNRPDGKYTFRVKATSPKWNIDPTPAEVSFIIAASPETTIEEEKPLFITTRDATIHFSGKDAEDATSALLYSWRFDNNEKWSEFSSETTATLKNPSEGKHSFQVRAKDTEGNIDPTPAEIVFDVASQFPDTQIINPPTKPIRTRDVKIQFTGSDRQTPTEKLKYSWHVDGGNWSEPNDTSEAAFEASETGWHLFEVKAIDEDGNEDLTPAQVLFQVVLPETIITNAPKETVKTADYTFGLQGSDVPKYKWRLDEEKKWLGITGTFVTVKNLSDGWHLFEAKAINQEGGEDLTPALVSFKVVVEKYFPETKIISVPTETVKTVDYTFGLQGSDIPKYKWRLDGKEGQEITGTFVTLYDLSNGEHVFEAIAINKDGSEDPTPESVSFKVAVEKSLSDTQITNKPKETVKTADYTFGLHGSDILKYKWRLDGGETWQGIIGTFVTLKNLPDGKHVFEAIAINQDGSEDPTSALVSFEVAVEKHLPDTQVTNVPEETDTVKTTDYTFGLHGSDVPKYKWRLDGKEWKETIWTFVTLKNLSDGKHVFEAIAINQDGSEDPTSALVSFEVAVEKSLPDTQIINPPPKIFRAKDYTFELQDSDVSQYQWRLDEGKWQDIEETSVTVPLSDGTHVFEAKAINQNGIEDPSPAIAMFEVLVQPPDTSILYVPNSPIKKANVTIRFTGDDLQTSTDKLQYSWRIDEGNWSEPLNKTEVTLKELDNGQHTFEVKAIDTDGNEDKTPDKISFKISVPFYKSRRFISLSAWISSILVLGFILYYFPVRYIQAYLKRKRKFNPYIVGDPILDEKMFFGRDNFLEKVIDGLSGGSIAIYGDRRIGKTSILRQIEKKLEKPYLPIYVTIESKGEDKFFKHLMNTIVEGCAGYISDTSELRIQQDDDRYSSSSFGSDLWKVIQQLKSTYAEDVILVLLLDEIDQTEEYDQSIHQVLRSFFMRHAGELKMISAGVRLAGKTWSKKTSPWYNFFSRIEVPPFTEEYAIKLIKEPVQHIYGYSNEAIEYIVKYSDCQPYYIQIFCRHAIGKIIEERRKKVTRADVEYVLTNVILKEYSFTFQDSWNTFSEELKEEILNALEVEGTPGKIGDKVNLDVLEDNNIINPFKEWIRRSCL